MPLNSTVRRNYGPSGPATVRLLKQVVRVEYDDGDVYDLPLAEWDKKYPQGKYFVGINRERTKITFISPPPDTYLVTFKEMKHSEKELPMPYVERGGPRNFGDKKWIAEDELRFRVVLSVYTGPCEGLEITYWLPYIFANDGKGECLLNGRKGQLKRMEDFLRAVGFDTLNDSIPYSDNVLPALEKIILRKADVFSVTLGDKGFVDSIVRVPEALVPKKSSAKKAPAKK